MTGAVWSTQLGFDWASWLQCPMDAPLHMCDLFSTLTECLGADHACGFPFQVPLPGPSFLGSLSPQMKKATT